jgi:hypothetical protein
MHAPSYLVLSTSDCVCWCSSSLYASTPEAAVVQGNDKWKGLAVNTSRRSATQTAGGARLLPGLTPDSSVLGPYMLQFSRMSIGRPPRCVSDRTMWRERHEKGAGGLRIEGAGRKVGHGVPLQVTRQRSEQVCPYTCIAPQVKAHIM